jgi:hypothetical protein
VNGLLAVTLQRVENEQLLEFTSTPALGELAHLLMTIEASTLISWSFVGVGNRLRAHPTEV